MHHIPTCVPAVMAYHFLIWVVSSVAMCSTNYTGVLVHKHELQRLDMLTLGDPNGAGTATPNCVPDSSWSRTQCLCHPLSC